MIGDFPQEIQSFTSAEAGTAVATSPAASTELLGAIQASDG